MFAFLLEILWMVAKSTSKSAPRNESMVETIPLVGIYRASSFQGFLGAGLRPSTVCVLWGGVNHGL